MIIKTYQKYLVRSYIKNLLLLFFIFLVLVFFLNILEEIKFFEKIEVNVFFPLFLTLLNIPSIMFEIFPFIFLLSTQLLFFNLINKDELIILKNHGINNMHIIKIITLTSFVCGIIIITAFYTFSSELKHTYLAFKNKYTDDNKYLAVINENGLWIKDEINNNINIINADIYLDKSLEKVTITQLDMDFNYIQTMIAEKANIEKKIWKLEELKIYNIDGTKIEFKKLDFQSNFDRNKINNLFSNLSSLNFVQILDLKKDYDKFGYSTIEIRSYLQKMYSIPIYVSLMTLIASILMLNIKYNRSKVFNITFGVLLSVSIYYINYFFNLLGTNEKLPINISVWLPYFIIFLFCMIGIVRINEK